MYTYFKTVKHVKLKTFMHMQCKHQACINKKYKYAKQNKTMNILEFNKRKLDLDS